MTDQPHDLSYILNELGEDREHYFSAVSPPIIQTSNFIFKKVDDLGRRLEDEMSGYLYSRGLNPTVEILRKKLAAIDGAEDCLVFNSGASAIFAGVLANVKAGDHIVSVRSPYTWAQRMFDVVLPRFNVSTTYVDGTKIENWAQASQPNTTLYYLESPNSWTFALQDINAVVALARSKGIITAIDNSYCTPLQQNVIEMGVDLAIQTATKYISGHSDTLGGVLSGSRNMIKRIFDSEYLNIGSGIQPFNAWLLIRGLRTLPLRLSRINQSTAQLINFLKQHSKIENIIFPFDASFPQYELAKQQMKDAGGLVTFIIKAKSREKIVEFCESLTHFMMAVSWGGHESLILPQCASVKASEFDSNNEEHRSVRMYVGLEDPSYLIADLEQALSKI